MKLNPITLDKYIADIQVVEFVKIKIFWQKEGREGMVYSSVIHQLFWVK